MSTKGFPTRSVLSFIKRIQWRTHPYHLELKPGPSSFYSNTPSVEDINNSFEYTESAPPYLDTAIFDKMTLAGTLDQLCDYASEFSPDVDGDEDTCEKFFWRNSQFSWSDAMAYYCFIRQFRPHTVLEIGSGFSTLIAIEAVRKNGTGQVICVEPYPRPFLEKHTDIQLRKQKAQDLSAKALDDLLQDGDIFFIDSTHTVKTGSDCLHIYLRLLPRLNKNIYVHAHDIFLPFPMPKNWLLDLNLFWTEQYLLLAFMIDNPKVKVLYGSAYNNAFNKGALDRLMGGKWKSGGGSLWFEYSGRLRGAQLGQVLR